MKNPTQHAKLLHDYHDKIKLTFEDIQMFANIEESIEKQATKHKPASVNSISKGKKAPPRSLHPQPKILRKNAIGVAPPGMKPLFAGACFVTYAKHGFTAQKAVVTIKTPQTTCPITHQRERKIRKQTNLRRQ